MRFILRGNLVELAVAVVIGNGEFINALLAFVIIAAVTFFLVIKPINALMSKRKVDTDSSDAPTRSCPHCVSDIPVAATRCAFCTSQVSGASI